MSSPDAATPTPPSPSKCPNCGSLIYSRRNPLCGRCGERLPADLLFTPEQREKPDADLKEIKSRRRKAAQNQPDPWPASEGGFLMV